MRQRGWRTRFKLRLADTFRDRSTAAAGSERLGSGPYRKTQGAVVEKKSIDKEISFFAYGGYTTRQDAMIPRLVVRSRRYYVTSCATQMGDYYEFTMRTPRRPSNIISRVATHAQAVGVCLLRNEPKL